MGSETETKENRPLSFYVINNGLITSQGMSGSDQRALNWARIFKARGHSITVVTPEVGRGRYSDYECIITSAGELSGTVGLLAGYIGRGIKTSSLLWKKLKDSSGILYSTSDLLPDVIPAIYCKMKRPAYRWISGLHLVAPNPFKGFKKISTPGYVLPALSNIYYFISQRLVMGFMRKYAELVMVSNAGDMEFLLNKGFHPDRVIVTYGAVNREDVDKASGIKQQYDACYVGRFHKQKGFPDLMEAWKLVCKKYPRAQIAIIGNDINFDQVVSQVKREGMGENVRFLGYLQGVEKYKVMKSSKMCVFPSTYESFGMVVAEAMSCGLPVVAYDLPVYDEIYPAGMLKAGIGDIEGLAERILKLLPSDQLRQNTSEEARKLSEKFTWEKTAQKILKRLN